MNKKIPTYVLFILLLFSLHKHVLGLDYKSSVTLKKNPTISNTQKNISSAILLEKYILGLKAELGEIKRKYQLSDNEQIKAYTDTLDQMIRTINDIQTTNVEKIEAEEIMKSIVDELKILNIKIKNLIKEKKSLQKSDFEKISNSYSKLALHLSRKLDKIIVKIYIPISKKKNLSLRDSKITEHLKSLKKESQKLKQLGSTHFQSKQEMKSSLIGILKNIKYYLSKIKNL